MRRKVVSNAHTSTFDQALDAVEKLTVDEQAELTDIVRKRIAERRREQILAGIEESRRELAEGKTKPATVDEIMREILS
jgi:hypothetical protein